MLIEDHGDQVCIQAYSINIRPLVAMTSLFYKYEMARESHAAMHPRIIDMLSQGCIVHANCKRRVRGQFAKWLKKTSLTTVSMRAVGFIGIVRDETYNVSDKSRFVQLFSSYVSSK